MRVGVGVRVLVVLAEADGVGLGVDVLVDVGEGVDVKDNVADTEGDRLSVEDVDCVTDRVELRCDNKTGRQGQLAVDRGTRESAGIDESI